MLVKKTKKLNNKKPLHIARKFRMALDDVRELQRGFEVDLETSLARTLKQWGMVKYVIVEQTKSNEQVEPEKSINSTIEFHDNTPNTVEKVKINIEEEKEKENESTKG
jgi:hypothetical protein